MISISSPQPGVYHGRNRHDHLTHQVDTRHMTADERADLAAIYRTIATMIRETP